MRVLLVHNHYREPGGEDTVVGAERALLEQHGGEVRSLEADNSGIVGFSGNLKAALGTVYSPTAKTRIANQIASFQPDIVHVHNFFPLLSPSVYYACREAGVPVVQTLHNYRLICPSGQMLRGGRVCEDCVGKSVPWPGVLHACYRSSRATSAAVGAMIATHRFLGTWKSTVDVFIALTDFSRDKLIEGGLPAEKIVVKPNFAPDPGRVGEGRGGFAFFVGRLSVEKGITTLLSAWERLYGMIPLKVAGDGPLREEVVRRADEGRIEYLGALRREEVLELMGRAALLIFPSLCYENFPLVIVEAFACGLPVVASRMGAMEEVIEHGRTGLHFQPGNAGDLAAKVEWALAQPQEMAWMRGEARAEYLAKYTPERNYEMLRELYKRVTAGKRTAKNGLPHGEIVR